MRTHADIAPIVLNGQFAQVPPTDWTCTFTYTATIATDATDGSAVAFVSADNTITVDTTTVDTITHLGAYTIDIIPATPETATEMTYLAFTINILEPCDPPQLVLSTVQPAATITIMRTVTASQTVDFSADFSLSLLDFTACPYTYAALIDSDVQSAFTFDAAT